MRKLTCFISAILFIACSPTGTLSVKNVQDITVYGNHSFVYSLPHTRLAIHITALRQYTLPGKYNKYAEKYLGIKDVPENPFVNWKMKNIEFESFDEPDPEYFFAVETKNTDYLLKNILQLKNEGLILKIDESNPFLQYPPNFTKRQQVSYTDIAAIENINPIAEENRMNKKVNVPVDLPVGKSKSELKTEEQKVQEAANFIFKIRKRRFKLLGGEYDSIPERFDMATSARELSRLEQEYLSLFIGKTYTDTIQRTFYYVPKPGTDADRFVICRFSEDSGFEDDASNRGKPLILELTDLQQTASLDRMVLPAIPKKNNNCVLYRIPDRASVHIYFGSVPVMEGEIKVFQYGTMLPYCISLKHK